jgi:NTE family protein
LHPNNSKRKKVAIDTKKITLSKITIHGIKNHTRAYVLGKLNLKQGDLVSKEEITKRIYSLSATKNYERISYTVNKISDTASEIVFSLLELSKKLTLELGVHYDLLYDSAILAKYK